MSPWVWKSFQIARISQRRFWYTQRSGSCYPPRQIWNSDWCLGVLPHCQREAHRESRAPSSRALVTSNRNLWMTPIFQSHPHSQNRIDGFLSLQSLRITHENSPCRPWRPTTQTTLQHFRSVARELRNDKYCAVPPKPKLLPHSLAYLLDSSIGTAVAWERIVLNKTVNGRREGRELADFRKVAVTRRMLGVRRIAFGLVLHQYKMKCGPRYQLCHCIPLNVVYCCWWTQCPLCSSLLCRFV